LFIQIVRESDCPGKRPLPIFRMSKGPAPAFHLGVGCGEVNLNLLEFLSKVYIWMHFSAVQKLIILVTSTSDSESWFCEPTENPQWI